MSCRTALTNMKKTGYCARIGEMAGMMQKVSGKAIFTVRGITGGTFARGFDSVTDITTVTTMCASREIICARRGNGATK